MILLKFLNVLYDVVHNNKLKIHLFMESFDSVNNCVLKKSFVLFCKKERVGHIWFIFLVSAGLDNHLSAVCLILQKRVAYWESLSQENVDMLFSFLLFNFVNVILYKVENLKLVDDKPDRNNHITSFS